MKPPVAALLSLILLTGCGSGEAAPSDSPDPMSSQPSAPEALSLDAAAPDDYATATFALG